MHVLSSKRSETLEQSAEIELSELSEPLIADRFCSKFCISVISPRLTFPSQ